MERKKQGKSGYEDKKQPRTEGETHEQRLEIKSTYCKENCAVDQVCKKSARTTRQLGKHGVHVDEVIFFGRTHRCKKKKLTRWRREPSQDSLRPMASRTCK
jgi:hypothetical protein